jgi:hypothetical protein
MVQGKNLNPAPGRITKRVWVPPALLVESSRTTAKPGNNPEGKISSSEIGHS